MWRLNRAITPSPAITPRHPVITRHRPRRATTSRDVHRVMAGETMAFAAMAVSAAMTASDATTAFVATEVTVAGTTMVGVADETAVIMEEAGAATVVAGIDS